MIFGWRRQSRTLLLIVSGAAGCGSGGSGQAPPEADAPPDIAPEAVAVLPGVDVLLQDSIHLVRGLRVGLVTNQTGVDRAGVSSIDRLAQAPETELVALFSPEHGIRGEAEAGVRIESGRDVRTGLPVHSLYGTTRKPTPEMLKSLDALLFDIQDIGTRYYTYIYTMALAMEAAGEAGIPFIVLDRPNPIGGVAVQGNVLDPAFASFVGLHPIPMRHGMTPGELARLFRGRMGVEARLHVVPALRWRRDTPFAETGLPWVAPSPNMPSVQSALHYPGTCLFEGTNLSVGRGTTAAFQQIGAPWIDGRELAERLNLLDLPGVRFEPVRFTPQNPGDGKFADVEVEGVRFVAEDPEGVGAGYDPVLAGVAAVVEARRLSGGRFAWRADHFDRLAGTDRLRRGIEEGRSARELREEWREELDAFRALREEFLIYR